MYNNYITMKILVNGKPVTEYSKNNKTFIEGRKNSTYTLEVTNHSYVDSILVIPTIDGLSIMNGIKASYESSGMILKPLQSYEFTGWRTDLHSVRQFTFANKKASYSNKTGQGKSNLGVIGLAAFKSKTIWPTFTFTAPIPIPWPITVPTPWPRTEPIRFGSGYKSSDNADHVEMFHTTCGSYSGSIGVSLNAAGNLNVTNAVAGIAQNSISEDIVKASIGTKMGEKQKSIVQNADFDRLSNPFCTMELYYNERRQLEKMGIIIKSNKKQYNIPQAFPGQFCKEV